MSPLLLRVDYTSKGIDLGIQRSMGWSDIHRHLSVAEADRIGMDTLEQEIKKFPTAIYEIGFTETARAHFSISDVRFYENLMEKFNAPAYKERAIKNAMPDRGLTG